MILSVKARAFLSAAVLVAGAACMSYIATWSAGTFGNHPLLGGTVAFGRHWYWPGQTLTWFPSFSFPYPDAFINAVGGTVVVGLFSLLLAVRFSFGGFLPSKNKGFGSEKWGDLKAAAIAGLLMGKGKAPDESSLIRFIGMLDGHPITITDDRFMIVFGPTGSGKTTCVMSTTGLTFSESSIFYSAGKGDIIKETSGFRATFSDIAVFDMGDPYTWRFNPLLEIRHGTMHEIADAMLLAAQFPPQSPSDAPVPIYPIEGTRMLAASIIHVISTAKTDDDKTLGAVYRLWSGGNETAISAMSKSKVLFVKQTVKSILELGTTTRDNVFGAVKSYISPWADPILDEITSASDWRISDLVCGDKPMTLYFRLPSHMRDTWRPVLKVIIGQIIRSMLFDKYLMPDGRKKKHVLLGGIDEFGSFYFPGFQDDQAEMRDYGMLFLLATQSPKSLEKNYGRTQTILENCRVQVYMASGDEATAKTISEMVGKYTEHRVGKSKSWSHGELVPTSGVRESEITRYVIEAGDVRSFPSNQMIVLPTEHAPFRVEKHPVYADSEYFNSRRLPPANLQPPLRKQKARISADDLMAS